MLDKIKGLKSTIARRRKTNKQPDDQYIVALDVGTEFVKALIGRVVETDQIEIVGTGRMHQELADMSAGAIADIAAVVSNCDQALAAAEEMAGVSVRSAVVGIAGELVKGTTTSVQVSRKNHEKEMDIEEVEKIIGLVQERALARAKKQLAVELGGEGAEVRLVNSAIVAIDIDGYPVSNPIGFKGRNVVVRLYTAFAPMIHIGALQRATKELDLELLAVAAEPFAVARSVIGNDPNASMSAVLMDVGGGTTDIAVINEGGVQGTTMFGIGGRAFTRSIERELSVDFPEAEELKLSLVGNKLGPNKRAETERALSKTLGVWLGGVEIALETFTNIDHLPHRILLCGGGSSLEMLMQSLDQSAWYKKLPFAKKPTVQYISPSQVWGITDLTGTVTDHTYITAMGLLRVGLDTLQQQIGGSAPTGSIRERLDRMLRI